MIVQNDWQLGTLSTASCTCYNKTLIVIVNVYDFILIVVNRKIPQLHIISQNNRQINWSWPNISDEMKIINIKIFLVYLR